MKTKSITLLQRLVLGATLTVSQIQFSQAQTVPGIPEPGLVMYGSVSNVNGGMPVTTGNVNWNVSGGGSGANVGSTIVNVNGNYFYVTRIPFETRSAGGVNFTASPNTLRLTDTATTFTRTATVLGSNAVILAPAGGSFQFSKVDRGRVERVNLSVNLSVDPALDSDGDGAPNWAEQIAGTNPNDRNSVFRASTDIQAAMGGGLIIKWSSVAGKNYSVQRTTDLGQAFTPLANNIAATAPQNQYTDATATGPGPFFYRISVNP